MRLDRPSTAVITSTLQVKKYKKKNIFNCLIIYVFQPQTLSKLCTDQKELRATKKFIIIGDVLHILLLLLMAK